jgi:type II secretory pathway component PulC
MRPRSVLPLAMLLLGCRTAPDTHSQPDKPLIDESAESESAGASEPERAPRPAGAVYRSEIVRATQGGSAAYLMSQLGPEPYRPQGRFEGWVVTRVWPGDPELCAPGCDLKPGDVLLSVNGSTLETPEQLSNLLARIDELESIDLVGIRAGEFFERTHPVLPDPALPE